MRPRPTHSGFINGENVIRLDKIKITKFILIEIFSVK